MRPSLAAPLDRFAAPGASVIAIEHDPAVIARIGWAKHPESLTGRHLALRHA